MIILRRWVGRVRTSEREEYVRYIERTGGTDYRETHGNLGFQMLMRDLDDGTSEVTTLSWWISLDAIKGFAGDDISRARYYPEDDRYLLDRPEYVEHHEVMLGRMIVGGSATD